MLANVEDYYWIMAARGRLIAIDEGRAGLCTFFILHDESEVLQFYDRMTWTTPTDAEDGSLIYVDKLLLYPPHRFTIALWDQLVSTFTQRVPAWQMLIWYRPRPGQQADRRYTLRRRRDLDGANLHR